MHPKTEYVSPLDLKVGDRVLHYGATLRVVHITVHQGPNAPQGTTVHACTSVLEGEHKGTIPLAYFDTPNTLAASGCAWAKELPPGLYWNVQGNEHARVDRIL